MIGGHQLARAAKATLEAQMPGAIAALNAETGAAQLPVPGTFYLYGRKVLPDLAVHRVAVEVSTPDLDFTDLDAHTLAADGLGLVQVTVWAQEVDFEVLIERLHRYASAVVSILAHHDASGPTTIPRSAAVRVRAADVDPESGADQQVTAGAAILVRVEFDALLSIA